MNSKPIVPKLNTQIKHDGPLQLAVGGSRHEKTWKHRTLLWSQLVGKLATTTRSHETMAEYKALPKNRQDTLKDVGAFVGGSLKGGKRSAQTVAWRQVITLDADFAGAGFWDLFTINYDCAACIYSTRKHTPENPRLRLVIPLSRSVTPDEYVAIARKVAGTLGIDLFDDTTYEPWRLMYWPSTCADADYMFEVQDGAWLDSVEILQSYGPGEAWRDPSQWPRSARAAQKIEKSAREAADPLAKPGLIGAFCRTYSIAEAIAKFLPDVYVEAGPGRWTYAAGSTAAGAVEYGDGRWLYSNHGTDPISGELVNAFDLVRLHRFGELDWGTSEGTSPVKLPSFLAMSDFAAADEDVRVEIIEKKNLDAKEDFRDVDNWRAKLKVNKKGDVEETGANVRLILCNDSSYNLGWNEFSQRPCVTGDLPWRKYRGGTDGEPWQDSDDAQLRLDLEQKYGLESRLKIMDGLNAAMEARSFHPVRGYLEGLWWDGEERLDSLLIDYLGAEDTPYVRAVTRKALVAAVARVMQPGCKFDYMLTLVGAQGIGKSKLVRKLAKRWFNDSITTVQGKDACEALRGFWLIEFGEMTATRKAEVEAVKAYISRQEDAYRESYGRRTNRYPRQCIFIGTTNDAEPLRDKTGGRRFWLVAVSGSGARSVDELDEDTIWAEAVQRYKKGEKLYLDAALEKLAACIQDHFTEESPHAGMIREFLEQPVPSDKPVSYSGEAPEPYSVRAKTCALQIWVELFDLRPDQLTGARAREINDVLRRTPGWVAARNPLSFGSKLGKQRGFVRIGGNKATKVKVPAQDQ